MSKDWGPDQGFEEIFRLAKKWSSTFQMPRVCWEATGQAIAFYEKSAREAARRVGVPYTYVKLQQTYKGKNQYFSLHSSKAGRDEFFICDKVEQENPDFLEMYLDQCRRWVCLPNGRNGLALDDCANVVSFWTDPVVDEFAPQPVLMPGMWDDEEVDEMPRRSRYCAI
jgi:hypothetical protein